VSSPTEFSLVTRRGIPYTSPPHEEFLRPALTVKYFLPFLFLLAFSSAFATETPTAKESPTCIVQGKVIQEPGDKPLKKATIQLYWYGEEGTRNYSTVTDADGNFKIEGVKPGRYNIGWDRAGFVQARKRGEHGRQKFITLEPGQEMKDLVLRMQPAAVLTGKILDSDGDPMPNVSISVSRYPPTSARWREQPGYTGTNDLGEFRISGLSPGRYLVTANAAGRARQTAEPAQKDQAKEELFYTTSYYPGTADKSQAVPVEVHAGEEIPINFGLVAARGFQIRGTAPKANPGTFAEVMLVSRSERSQTRVDSRAIGADGTFEFQGVLPGSYSLRLVVSSFPDMQTMSSAPVNVEVSNGDVDGVRLQHVPGSRVHGRLRLDGGQKIDWSQLSVFLLSDNETDSMVSYGNRQPTFARVKNDGFFEIKDVPAGTYRVIVESNDRALRDYITKSVNLDGQDVEDSGFTVGGATYALDIVISVRAGTIEGTVLDSKDHAVPYATVVCVPGAERRKRRDLFRQDTTDEQGHFHLRGLNPGEYTVLAWEDLEDDYRDPEFLKSNEARGQNVRLDEGDRKSISLKVIPSASEEP
jgi:protocatechuate 3,4-dioxygenase beta subunit